MYEALEQYLTGLEEQLQQLKQIAQRISDRRGKMCENALPAVSFCNNLFRYDFVKTLGPIFSSLSRDDARSNIFLLLFILFTHPLHSLSDALVAISRKCDAITSMYKAQCSSDESRLAVPLQMCACFRIPTVHFCNILTCTNLSAFQPGMH